MRLEWSSSAEHNVTQLRDYIAEDSPFYAYQFIERLLIAIERLQDFPAMGRPVPEAGHREDIREIIYQGYRVIYRVLDPECLQIVAVVHGARDLGRADPPPWES
jgi:toxin ParE1/3/4